MVGSRDEEFIWVAELVGVWGGDIKDGMRWGGLYRGWVWWVGVGERRVGVVENWVGWWMVCSGTGLDVCIRRSG